VVRVAFRGLSAAVALTAAVLLIEAAWIPAKAALGQWLLERSWRLTLETGQAHRPWPWADTTPVAVLEVPRLGVRQVVVSGASGRNLAWAPAALTGEDVRGDVILSGHRDTHFRFLEHLGASDRLRLLTPAGVRHYRVTAREVVDSRTAEIVIEAGAARLTLVTCYPFDAFEAGGPWRYVVTALPLEPPPDPVGGREATAGMAAG